MSLDEFEKGFRGYLPKQVTFLNLKPLFDKGVFRIFDLYFTILDTMYSVDTGWVYKLDNGWWVQEFMGAISSRHIDEVRIKQYSLVESDKLFYNFSYDHEKPRVHYKFIDIHDALWGVLNVRGKTADSHENVYFDNYTPTSAEDVPLGYTRSPNGAVLGKTYRDSSGTCWIVAEIYDSEGELEICLTNGSPSAARRIKDSHFSDTPLAEEIVPFKPATEVQCLTPGLEFFYGIVGATVTSKINGTVFNYCAVIKDGEGKWYPWSILNKVGFQEKALHVPKDITGFVSYIELTRPGIMYLDDVEEATTSRKLTKISRKKAELKITPAEKATAQKLDYMSNSLMWAGGATLIILAINIFISKNG
jgi:hypothetical protein